MKFGLGFSAERDTARAVRDASRAVATACPDPALLIGFTTETCAHDVVLDELRRAFPAARIVGFCCGGVIADDRVHSHGLGLCGLGGPGVRVATTLQRGLNADPAGVGRRAAEALLASGIERGALIVLPDGLQANLAETLRAVYNAMGPDYCYMGGGAGDNLHFFKTYQFTEEGMASDALAMALVDGCGMAAALGHGWVPMGDPLIISRASGKTVAEIDGQPAFQAYSAHLGAIPRKRFPEFGMRHPLGFPDLSGHYLIRDPLALNEDESIQFVTEVPAHAVGNIMQGNVPDLIAAAGEVAAAAAAKVRTPQFGLLFECISRWLLMGEAFGGELAAIRAAIGPQVPLLGALTFGEIGSSKDVPLLHNKTAVVALGRDPAGPAA